MRTHLVLGGGGVGRVQVDQKPQYEEWIGTEAGLVEFQRLGSKEPEEMGIPEGSRLGSLAGLVAGWNRKLGPWAMKSWLA